MYRQLCFGDNLGMMRAMPPSRVQLCCTDPPFNSGANYNMFLGSDAQRRAFTDIWKWDDAAIENHADIQRQAANRNLDSDVQQNYADVDRFLKGFAVMHDNPTRGKMAELRAYLTFMAPRIVEIRRVLAETGSFYLHCDAHASHYLKTLCDVVFGVENFRNEIVWCYGLGGSSKRTFSRKHDLILLYSKTNGYIFHKPMVKSTSARMQGKPKGMLDYWTDIPSLNNMARERRGYPTQKPIALYERLIKASSNPGDIVLDPFCGCGTTIDAAETNGRGWIGIDITIFSMAPIEERMSERHNLKAYEDYHITGFPCNMQEVSKMLADGRNSKRYKDFEQWAVTRLGMKPTNYVGDGGIDGEAPMIVWEPETMQESQIQLVGEVKAGTITPSVVRDFRTAMHDKNATVGILIGLAPISRGVKDQMRKAGTFTHNNEEYPRLQYWQITEEYFNNARSVDAVLKLPWRIKEATRSEMHAPNTQLLLTDPPVMDTLSKSRLAPNHVYFEEAQNEVGDEVIAPSVLAEALDEIIGSERELAPHAKTFGEEIVAVLQSSQKYGGLHWGTMLHINTECKLGRHVRISEPQAERAWKYLCTVCIERGDSGLAPPFHMELT